MMILRSIVLAGCVSFSFPHRANAKVRGQKMPVFRELIAPPQTPYCTAGACVFDTVCDCCDGDLDVLCDDYFADPAATCGEAPTGGITEVNVPGRYELTEDRNCGWDPTETIENNNDNGKWVCDDCTNDHQGFDIPPEEDVNSCAAICNRSSECAGFAHFLPGILGADCASHGAKEEGSCYFRRHGWIERGFEKPYVNCYQKKGGGNERAAAKKKMHGDKR